MDRNDFEKTPNNNFERTPNNDFERTQNNDFGRTSNNDFEFARTNGRAPTGRNYGNNYGQGGFDMSPMTVGEWIITLLIMCIPCVGIVMYFVWAFSSTGNINRRNFCRAQLIFVAVILVLYLLIFVVIGIGATNMYRYGYHHY